MNMKKVDKLLAIIPVKGNSERVAKKNVRPFADTNLLELKLKQLQSVDGADKIVVSSEDPTVLDLAKKYNVELHLRDPFYSTSHVPMSSVYTYLASEFSNFDTIMWVNVTNPLAGPDIYSKAIQKYKSLDEKYDCLLSVSEIQDYFIYRGEYLNFQPNPWPRSQDLEPLQSINFVTNILAREDLKNWGSLVGKKPYFWPLDKISSMDIDFPEDFEYCEYIYRKNKN